MQDERGKRAQTFESEGRVGRRGLSPTLFRAPLVASSRRNGREGGDSRGGEIAGEGQALECALLVLSRVWGRAGG